MDGIGGFLIEVVVCILITSVLIFVFTDNYDCWNTEHKSIGQANVIKYLVTVGDSLLITEEKSPKELGYTIFRKVE